MGGRMDPRKQFSKKLAGRAEWFWFGYMTLAAYVAAKSPAASMAAVYLAVLTTAVMIASVLAYTGNSKYEKGLWAARDIAKVRFAWKNGGASLGTDAEGDDDPSDEVVDDSADGVFDLDSETDSDIVQDADMDPEEDETLSEGEVSNG